MFIMAIVLVLAGAIVAQVRPFIPVEGASLKAKIDNAIAQGRANAQGGRFWVGYQFEARPGVAILGGAGRGGVPGWRGQGWAARHARPGPPWGLSIPWWIDPATGGNGGPRKTSSIACVP